MAQENLQLSPEEERLLRSFFHRQTLPYAAVAIVLAVLVSGFVHGFSGADSTSRLGRAKPSAAEIAAFQKTRDAAEQLLVELQQAARRDQDGLVEAERRMNELEKRLAGARERLQKLDARVQEIAASATSPPPPAAAAASSSPAVASPDEDGSLERRHNLEVRQDQLEARDTRNAAERTEAMKEILNPLHALETPSTAAEPARASEVSAATESSGAH